MHHLHNFIALRPVTWLDELVERYKIDVSEDDGLVSLKYNQIESPMAEPVVQQCRGAVVERATGRILCHPYDKFWNLGETLAAPIEWSTARVQDKLDGSLMLLFERDDVWRVASSGHPTAGGSYGKGNTKTFRDMFWETFEALGMELPPPWGAYRNIGFFFELCAPDNRIVCRYDQPRIVLHGARDRETGIELHRDDLLEIAAMYEWEVVREYPLKTMVEVLDAVRALDPGTHEGFVVVDHRHHRVKVKSPRYVALHQLKEKVTPGAVIGLWKAGGGEINEVLAYFPEFEGQIMDVVMKLELACGRAFDLYQAHKDLPTRKEYAAEIMRDKPPWASVCFKLLDNHATSLEEARAILRASFDTLCEKILEAPVVLP